MKTKKTVIVVLTVALIAAFIVSCITTLDETNPVVSEKSVPEGKTLVSISLGASKSNARTILPDTSGYDDANDFSHFRLTVWDVEEEEFLNLPSPLNGIFPIDDVYNSGTDIWTFNVTLTAKTEYIFTILAYDSASTPNENTAPVAWGTSGEIEVDADGEGSDDVSINLHEIFLDADPLNTSHVGKFSWNFAGITLSAYDSHEVRLAPIGTPASNIISAGGNASSGTETGVEPGIYMVIIVLSKDGYESEYVREIIYIFSGFETKLNSTTFTQTLPTLRRNRFTISFDYGDDQQAIDDRPSDLDVNFGVVIKTVVESLFTTHNSGINVPIHSGGDHHFNGWLYDDENGNSLGDGEKMYKDITLYATWEEDAPPPAPAVINLGGLALTWTTDDPAETPDFTGSVATYDGNKLDLVLKVADLTGDSYSWYHGSPANAPFASGDDVAKKYAFVNGIDDYDLMPEWFQIGKHRVYLTVTIGLDMYTCYFEFDNP